MENRNVKVIVDLHNFFEDHRKKAFLLINDKITKISDLQNHIENIFNINNFYLIKEDCYLPEEESIKLIEENDVIKVKPVKNELNEETAGKIKKKKHKHKEVVEIIENEESPMEIDLIEPPVKKKKKKSKSSSKDEEMNEIVVSSESQRKIDKPHKNQIVNNADQTSFIAKNVLHLNYRKPQQILPNTEEYLKNKRINIIRIDVVKSDNIPNENSLIDKNELEKNENLGNQFENICLNNLSNKKSSLSNSNLDLNGKISTENLPVSSNSVCKIENNQKLSLNNFPQNNSELNKNDFNDKIESENNSLNDPFFNSNNDREINHFNSTEIENSNKTTENSIKTHAETFSQCNSENNNTNISKVCPNQSNTSQFNKYKLKKVNSGIGSFLSNLRQTVPETFDLITANKEVQNQINAPVENSFIPINNFTNIDVTLKNEDLLNSIELTNSVNQDSSLDSCLDSISTLGNSEPEKIRRKRIRKRAKKKKVPTSNFDLNLPPIINNSKPINVKCDAKPTIHIKFNDNDEEIEEKSKVEEISIPEKSLNENQKDLNGLNNNLKPGDKIQFQILRISQNYTPEFSSPITGEIKEIDLTTNFIRLNISSGLDQCIVINGKFHLDVEQDRICGSLQEFKFTDLLNVKLIK